MISSEIAKQYLLEEDAVEGFRTAVNNGQVRLALQILTEIVDGIMEIFDVAFSEDDEDQPKTFEVSKKQDSVTVPVEQEEKHEPVKEEVTKEVKKPTAKKTAEATPSE